MNIRSNFGKKISSESVYPTAIHKTGMMSTKDHISDHFYFASFTTYITKKNLKGSSSQRIPSFTVVTDTRFTSSSLRHLLLAMFDLP